LQSVIFLAYSLLSSSVWRDGPEDVGADRYLMPAQSIAQYGATPPEWFGVANSDLHFPELSEILHSQNRFRPSGRDSEPAIFVGKPRRPRPTFSQLA
jgi:hypothetical protein